MRAPRGLLVVAIVCAGATTAGADRERLYLRADLDVRLGFGELDLAEQAGQDPGGDSELSPGLFGVILGAGLDTRDVAIGIEAAIYIGGLDASEVGERYLGGSNGAGSSTVLAGLAAAYRRPLRGGLDGVGRLGLGLSRHAVSGPSGDARIDNYYMDIGGGLGYPIQIGSIPARVELVGAVRIQRLWRFSVDGLTDGTINSDAPAVYYFPGLSASFVLEL